MIQNYGDAGSTSNWSGSNLRNALDRYGDNVLKLFKFSSK